MRKRLAKAIAPTPKVMGKRMYSTARQTRLTSDWYSANDSADNQLSSSLRMLRGRSRTLMRDTPFAKRAKLVVVNNVVGSGIGMQAAVESTRGSRIPRVNDDIESAWADWSRAENCHTGGKLCFADLERQAFGQIFEAGEIFIRKHYRAFGTSQVPLALELVEPERIADDYQAPAGTIVGLVRMGIECDEFHRPIAIWIHEQHPSELVSSVARSNRLRRVPSEQMFHLHLVDRWPQTRGEPWLHSVAKRLQDMDGTVEAEIVAARAAASYMGIIESPEPPLDQDITDEETIPPEFTLEPGAVKHLLPGEKFSAFEPNRPNTGLDQFMRMLLREVAAGAWTSYESLSRDYSQSNYSSSRLALIDDRDAWRMLQQWFIRAFRLPLHREWMQAAVLAGAIPSVSPLTYALDMDKYNAVCFKPRGWSWVDPTKEVEAYKQAVRCGFMTVSDVISLTGGGKDLEDVLTERGHELEQMDELDLEFDTSPGVPANGQPVPEPAPTEPAADPGPAETPARVINLRS